MKWKSPSAPLMFVHCLFILARENIGFHLFWKSSQLCNLLDGSVRFTKSLMYSSSFLALFVVAVVAIPKKFSCEYSSIYAFRVGCILKWRGRLLQFIFSKSHFESVQFFSAQIYNIVGKSSTQRGAFSFNIYLPIVRAEWQGDYSEFEKLGLFRFFLPSPTDKNIKLLSPPSWYAQLSSMVQVFA